MLSAIVIQKSLKNVIIKFSDGQKFKVSREVNDIWDKLQEQLKIYFGCSYMPDWVAYDIPDEEIESVEISVYQQFGKIMEKIK